VFVRGKNVFSSSIFSVFPLLSYSVFFRVRRWLILLHLLSQPSLTLPALNSVFVRGKNVFSSSIFSVFPLLSYSVFFRVRPWLILLLLLSQPSLTLQALNAGSEIHFLIAP